MQLSTRGRYAVMAMVELAAQQEAAEAEEAVGDCPRGATTLAEIAAEQHLSLAYLEQIFARLRRAGLVAALRGPGGGYRLARPAAAIAVADIIAAVDERIEATRCEPGAPGCLAADPARPARRCRTHDLWAALGETIACFLAEITLADVLAGRVGAPLRSESLA